MATYTGLYYETRGSFKGLDIMTHIAGLAKAYASLPPIEKGSVPIITLTGDNHFLAENDFNHEKVVDEILRCGTKPLDALSFVASMLAKDEEAMTLFSFVKGENNVENQKKSIALLASAVIIFVSRGAFPTSEGKRGNSNLPDFIKNLLGEIKIESEKELAVLLSSFDSRHIRMTEFFKEENLKGWDDIMANRLNLGVAGHKPLKVTHELYKAMITTGDSREVKYVQKMAQLYTEMRGGFYPELHPSKQAFALKYKGFYQQSLCAIFDAIAGSKEEKLQIMQSSNALKNEKFIHPDQNGQVAVIHEIRTYHTWNLHEMEKDIGYPAKFTSGKLQATKPEEVVELREETPIASTSSTSSSMAFVTKDPSKKSEKK
jgi:hypothetical protein